MYIKGLSFLELDKVNYFKLVGFNGVGIEWRFKNEDDEPLYLDDDYKILLQEKNVLLVRFLVKGRIKIEAYTSLLPIVKKDIDLEELLKDKESIILPSDNIFKELKELLKAQKEQAEYDRLELERIEAEQKVKEEAEAEAGVGVEQEEIEEDKEAEAETEQAEPKEEIEAPADEELKEDSVVTIVTEDTAIEKQEQEEAIEEEPTAEAPIEEEPIVEPELLSSRSVEVVVPFGLVNNASYLCNLFFDTYREFQPLYVEGRLSGADLVILANRAFVTFNILNKGKRAGETLATCMVLAHMISISSNYTSGEGEAGLGGLGFGGISSASLGDVSLSFDSKPIKTMLDSYFSSTPYGLEFLQWYHSRPTLTTIN